MSSGIEPLVEPDGEVFDQPATCTWVGEGCQGSRGSATSGDGRPSDLRHP